AGARDADIGGVADCGAIYVWAGGPSLAGATNPTATLTVTDPNSSDQLGENDGQGIYLVDVTGDRIRDVVAAAQFADPAGVQDAGAIYLWNGGPNLSGSIEPDATLFVPGAAVEDRLGTSDGESLQFGDLDRDGILDLVCVTRLADDDEKTNVGALYFWKGGALADSEAPAAALTVPSAKAFDALGVSLFAWQQGFALRDVTGDGRLDVIAGAAAADVGGLADAGAIYIWSGASLSGAVEPAATLFVPGTASGDRLGSSWGEGIADVTGDGILDVIAGSRFADVGGVVDAGAIWVWSGGTGLAGPVGPTVALTVPGAGAGDFLSIAQRNFNASDGGGPGIVVADVTGDGVADVSSVAPSADVGPYPNSGAAYVWAGGSTLQAQPTATLRVP
ncbi:MAG: hypothetical protein L0206_22120, partial [Actinobacteria bacterium]|nr:hypothetical protein [Actinomycetota bacterium]